MRNPSYTKRGPGRRPAHVNKALAAAWDKLVGAQVKAQKRRAQKKSGHATAWLRPYHAVIVSHDGILSKRDNRLYLSGNYVGSY